MPILDRIKFDGVNNNEKWLIYKMPPENIAWGSQLIVGIGQEAIFIKGGQALDTFTSGTYTLESGNLPLFRSLVNLPFGGKTPFAAEIVYVNLTNNLGLKWGTSSPINVEDPKYGLLLGLRAFGQFGVRILNGRLFLHKLIGTVRLDSGFNHNLILEQFGSLINTRLKTFLTAFLGKNQISFLQVAAYYEEMSTQMLDTLKPDFEGYGIELVNFLVESVSPPKEQFERLRQYKEQLALGEGFYDKKRSFDVFEGMANSQIGGFVGLGMGMGATAPGGSFDQLAQKIGITTITNATSGTITCSFCGKTVEAGSAFCRYCGQKLPQDKFCAGCGKQLEPDAAFCSSCGRKCS